MANTTSLNFTVPSMSCGHCVAAITTEVQQVPGVSVVTIDLEAKSVVVTGELLDEGTVRAAIVEAGYEALA